MPRLTTLYEKFNHPYISAVIRGRIKTEPRLETTNYGPSVVFTIERTIEYPLLGTSVKEDLNFNVEAPDELTVYENTTRGNLAPGQWILAVCTLRPVAPDSREKADSYSARLIAIRIQLVDGSGD